MAGKWKQGLLNITADMGYNGQKNQIRYMSSWELKAFQICIKLFKAGRIKGWQSEETQFQYIYSIDQKEHKYYMDLTLTTADKTIFVEIKPHSEHAQPPRPPKGKITESYQKQALTWIKNQCKWDTVRNWVDTENDVSGIDKYKFVIWDEYTLGIK